VILIQQESNSFAVRATSLRDFTIYSREEAEHRLLGSNSEFAGICEQLGALGATTVPLLYAHSLPALPLDSTTFSNLCDLLRNTLENSTPLDGLVVSLHGALSCVDYPNGDVQIMNIIRGIVGPQVPISLCLDLHANITDDLIARATVVTGYQTNPHVDQAQTGRRSATLMAQVMSGQLTPTMHLAKCPAIFPDESLRIETGTLGEILEQWLPQCGESVIDVSVFPTQPWLDAPGIGFGALVVTHNDVASATFLAESITQSVWDRRHEFVVERLMSPDDALITAERSTTRPFIITESADAPTAGGTGDSPAMLHALNRAQTTSKVFVTVVDSNAVDHCRHTGKGSVVELSLGASIDRRWSRPAEIAGEVAQLGDGTYVLTGIGYEGLTVSMGRFAVVQSNNTMILITELPAWSADPGTWMHAGLDPFSADVLILRSCTDYIANFPASALTAVVADVPGAATPRLDQLKYTRCGTIPFPVNPHARYSRAAS